MLDNGLYTLEIAENMNCDYRTMKDFVFSQKTGWKIPKRSHLRRLSSRDVRKLKTEIAKTRHGTSKSIFMPLAYPKWVKLPVAKR